MPEVLLASHIVVLEGPGGGTLEEHMARGESFIEVVPWCNDFYHAELHSAVTDPYH